MASKKTNKDYQAGVICLVSGETNKSWSDKQNKGQVESPQEVVDVEES